VGHLKLGSTSLVSSYKIGTSSSFFPFCSRGYLGFCFLRVLGVAFFWGVGEGGLLRLLLPRGFGCF
jgi:hypothetical protein